MIKRFRDKWFPIFLILSNILCIFLSLSCIGRAVYVISNHLVNFDITDDAASNNPFMLLVGALVLAVCAIALFSIYQSEKEFRDTIDKLYKRMQEDDKKSNASDNQ